MTTAKLLGADRPFSAEHYVPILKGREGEYAALRELKPDVKESVTPVIDVPPVRHENEDPVKSLDDHITTVVTKLAASWGNVRPVLVDLDAIRKERPIAGGGHAWDLLASAARDERLLVVPVTALSRESAYIVASSRAASLLGCGASLRLVMDDFADPSALQRRLTELLAVFGLTPGQVDLIVDLREVRQEMVSNLPMMVQWFLSSLPSIREWRSLILAGTGFPETLSEVKASSAATLPRREWGIWQTLWNRHHVLQRMPTFSDYGIAHPAHFDVEGPTNMSANLRYTIDEHWLVLKGRNVREHGYEQFFALCQDLIARPEYDGFAFSAGDHYFYMCANEADGPGNGTKWRQAGTSHHITKVVRQLASLSAT